MERGSALTDLFGGARGSAGQSRNAAQPPTTQSPPTTQIKVWGVFMLKSPKGRRGLWGSQDDPLSSKTPTPDLMDRGYLDGENDV